VKKVKTLIFSLTKKAEIWTREFKKKREKERKKERKKEKRGRMKRRRRGENGHPAENRHRRSDVPVSNPVSPALLPAAFQNKNGKRKRKSHDLLNK